ncbi:unnamed protein product [Rhodiola kirilowii]
MGVWENQCDNPGYWIWLCAKICSEEEFTALLCGLWMGWRDRNERVHGKTGTDLQQTGEAGAGAVLCWKGKIEGVRAEWANDISSVLEAECRAIKLGMELAMELNLNKITLLSDSSEVLWAINMKVWRSGSCGIELRDCVKLLEEHPGWSIGSINRDSNTAADWSIPRGVVEIPDWRISRRPTEFCDNARFFAAPVQPKKKEDKDKMGPRLNEQITSDVVRLVISEDEHVIISLREAFQRAQRLGMDLVEVDRKAEPPVCKIMDFHKEKYLKKSRDKEISKTKTKIKTSECKEIRLTPKIEQKDLEMKANTAIRLIESGYRVKCTVSGKEREDVGGTLSRLCALFEDAAIVESGPRVDRKQAYIVVRHAKFGPSKSGGAKKISQISANAFSNIDPSVAEDADNAEPESKQNDNEDLDKNKSTSSGPERYKKNNPTSNFPQKKSAGGVRLPDQPPNINNGFPSVLQHGPNDRNPRPPGKEIPRPPGKEIPRQHQPIRESTKPATSYGVFSSDRKTNSRDRRLESERRPESDRRPPVPTLEKDPKPEKTFGIFSKR